MVATSLPFWMQQPARTMVLFSADGGAQEGRAARAPRPTASYSSNPVVVELCSPAAMDEHLQAWSDLAARAVEPNVFMEPGFALAAALHLPPAERPSFLLCWEHAAEGGATLVGLLALADTRGIAPGVARAWDHPQWVTAAPLLDRARGAVALDAILGWLADRQNSRIGLRLQGISRDGALMRLLEDGGRRAVAVLAVRQRAVLENGADRPGLAAKQAKELRRQWRRLGNAVVTSARTPDEVRAATEHFLALEARGWKGAAGTALLADSHLATFTRTMTRLMAQQGLCRIDTLAVDGEPVAMGIVLRSGDRGYFWKTAFDETRARQSPGKQLARAIGELQHADETLAMTDSCAIPDHPMIDRLWTGRMEVADVLIACSSASGAAFRRSALLLRGAGLARAAAKRGVKALKHRLRRG